MVRLSPSACSLHSLVGSVGRISRLALSIFYLAMELGITTRALEVAGMHIKPRMLTVSCI
jgi:hypothetical protein